MEKQQIKLGCVMMARSGQSVKFPSKRASEEYIVLLVTLSAGGQVDKCVECSFYRE